MDPNQNPRPGAVLRPNSSPPPSGGASATPFGPPTPAVAPAPFPPTVAPPQLDNSPSSEVAPIDPYDSEHAVKKSPNKKLFAIAGGAFVLIALIVVVISAITSKQPVTKTSGNLSSTAQKALSTPLPEAVNRTDGTLDLTRRVETSRVIHAQVVQAKLGQQVNLSNGLSILARAIANYDSSTIKPAAGKKFVIVLVVAGNHALTEHISVSYLDFKLRDSTNHLLNSHAATLQLLNNPLANPTELKPSDQVEGRLIYEVGADEQEWTLVHKESYRRKTDDTTFVVEGRIALDTKPVATTPPAKP